MQTLRAPGDLGQVYAVSVDALADKLKALVSTLRRLHTGDDPGTEVARLARRLAPLDSTEDAAWRKLNIVACMRQ